MATIGILSQQERVFVKLSKTNFALELSRNVMKHTLYIYVNKEAISFTFMMLLKVIRSFLSALQQTISVIQKKRR